MSVDFGPLAAIRLRSGDFEQAQRVNLEALLRLDTERLLVPHRREAGIPASAEPYGGWEDSGLGGHTVGHVLSALALSVAAGADSRARDMLGTLIRGLRDAQLALTTGYLGGVPEGQELWEELARGTVEATPFDLNGRWVPLYNLHKTLAGLIDVAEQVPSEEADELLDDLGQWWLAIASRLDQETLERILVTEFGGFTESFARLALLRKDERYLYLAKRFVRQELLERVLTLPGDGPDDPLAGMHANTQIPVIVGYATIERAARELGWDGMETARLGTAARLFFEDVVHRSSALGGHGVREHFHGRDDFTPMFLAREGPESCNTYNMVKLAAALYLLDEDSKYLDYIELAQCGHVLSTQHPEHGGLVYFTSHRPGHYRVYSPEQDGFWCCMGSGFEAHARHGAHAYATRGDELRIAWLLTSEMTWAEYGAVISIYSDLPEATGARIQITVQQPREFTIAIRIPPWAANAGAFLADGTPIDDDGQGWWRVRRSWIGTQTIDVSFEATVNSIPAPDGSPWAWIQRGPTVYAQEIPDPSVQYQATAARTAHIASGQLRPLAETPVLIPSALEAKSLSDGTLTISTADGERIALKPLHRIHNARYRISWPVAEFPTQVPAVHAALEELDRASTSLEARVVDGVIFGEQQPELDHEVSAPQGERGTTTDGRQWLRPAGSLTLVLRDWTVVAQSLRIEWLPDHRDMAVRLSRAGENGVVVHADSSGVWEMPFATHGQAETRLELTPVEGYTMPRLTRLLMLTDTADGPIEVRHDE
ncbi:glycoside hydrolase family 127 protein (plasmid) [Arthrobacter sp. D3-18]